MRFGKRNPEDSEFRSATETEAIRLQNEVTRGRRRPTDQDLRELFELVLTDIHRWSVRRGYGNVPPIVFLRQITAFSDAMGIVFHPNEDRDPGGNT